MGSHCDFTKPQGRTIGVPPRIHRTPREHHWGSTANSQNPKGASLWSHRVFIEPHGYPKGAPLGFHREFTKPQGRTIGVPPRIHRTPRVHHWGSTANSQNPKGASLWSHRVFIEPHGYPKGAPLGFHREFTISQGCTIGVPPPIHKTPRVHHWDPTANSQNP